MPVSHDMKPLLITLLLAALMLLVALFYDAQHLHGDVRHCLDRCDVALLKDHGSGTMERFDDCRSRCPITH